MLSTTHLVKSKTTSLPQKLAKAVKKRVPTRVELRTRQLDDFTSNGELFGNEVVEKVD